MLFIVLLDSWGTLKPENSGTKQLPQSVCISISNVSRIASETDHLIRDTDHPIRDLFVRLPVSTPVIVPNN